MSEEDRITQVLPRYQREKTPRHTIVLWIVNIVIWPFVCGLAFYTFIPVIFHKPVHDPQPSVSIGMGSLPGSPTPTDEPSPTPIVIPSPLPPEPPRVYPRSLSPRPARTSRGISKSPSPSSSPPTPIPTPDNTTGVKNASGIPVR